MIYLLIILSLLFAIPAYAADTFREVLMQNAAVATGNGTAITVDYFTTVSVEVTITNTATITWEESITGSTWNTGSCIRSNDPATPVTTATTSGLYHCNLAALTKFRARISAYTSGTVTAYARTTVTDFDILRGSSSGAAGAGLTDAQLRATPVPISGTVSVTDGAGALNVIVDSLPTVTVTDGAGAMNVIVDSLPTVTVTDGAGSLNVIVDSGTITSITNSVTVTDGAGALNVIVDSLPTVTVTDGAGSLNVIVDSGTITSITNSVTVTDGAGALNVIVDSLPTVTVTDGAGSLNTIVDSGTLTAVTSITNPVTVTDGSGSLNVIVDSGSITTVPPSNASTNIAQIAGVAPSVTNPLPTRDGNGTSFFSSDTIGANVYKKVSAIQDIELSSGNSSTVNLASRAIFTGTSQTTLGVGAIQVNLYSDQPALIQVQQAQEDPGTGWNIVDSWLYMAGSMGSDAARTIQATGASTRVVVTNTGDATTTTFNLTTAMCPVCDSLPRGLTQAGNLKTAILEPTPILNALPVAVMRSAAPVPPVLPPNLNRLQYASSMRTYCMQTLCPPLPGGFK